MKKTIAFFLFYFITTIAFGQKEHKNSSYLYLQYTSTIHDQTIGNNPWGLGLDLQTFWNTKTIIKPSFEISGDLYLEDDKTLRIQSGIELEAVKSVVNLFGGGSFHAVKNIYFSLLGGPSLINGKPLLGIKPSIGLCFSNDQKWAAKLSYINIFNRGQVAKEDFSSISFSIGLKLY